MMSPSHIPGEELHGESEMLNFTTHGQKDTEQITQSWQLNEECPEGTIPILRTKIQDFLNAIFIKSIPYQFSSDTKCCINQESHEHAFASAKGTYYGAKATINDWQPKLQRQKEHSWSRIWIIRAFGSNENTIQAGWPIDGYKSTGCYNLLCPGFVQIAKNVLLGNRIEPISVYAGKQYEITIHMWKDGDTNAWWLKLGEIIVGYWPASLFTNLAKSPSAIQWGGEVLNLNEKGHTTTQMGSGHFAEEGFGGASYFKNVLVAYEEHILSSPK